MKLLLPVEDVQIPVRFAARQPIFSLAESVLGYELLYRSGAENYFGIADPNIATQTLIDAARVLGFRTLSDNHLAFINCTRETLLEESLHDLPPNNVVVEVLETIEPDAAVRRACRRLRDSGYKIALDDFVLDDHRESLVELANFIKVDFRQVSREDVPKIVARFRGGNRQLLAEKVETQDEHEFARGAGFQCFQGYAYRPPQMMCMSGVRSDLPHVATDRTHAQARLAGSSNSNHSRRYTLLPHAPLLEFQGIWLMA